MKFIISVGFFAIAIAGVEATKLTMHGGRLTLQDLLALRNGNMLPSDQMVMHMVNGHSANEDASVSASAATPRATDDLAADASGKVMPPPPVCILVDFPEHHCDADACVNAGGGCILKGSDCESIPQDTENSACIGCMCVLSRVAPHT